MTRRGTENGFKLAIHAIGDEANSLCFKTLVEGPRPLPGSTVEHAQLLNFADLPLFKRLGLTASVQPQHMVDDRDTCAKFWPGREGRAWAFRSIVDAGIPMKLGSDCPVAPMQPWDAMAVCLTRAAVGDSPLCAEQIIDLETAWAASTSVSTALIRPSEH
jgi:predicted amidohydrolase YtcJ